MKTSKLLLLLILLSLTRYLVAQNSLYLVDTLTGTATNNKLWKAEGIGDFNGDGYADFVVCYSQYIDLYFGNAQFKPQIAHRFYMPPLGPPPYRGLYNYYPGFAYKIGDVNGDGYSDLMIITGDTSYARVYPYAEIIMGGSKLDTIPKFKYYPPYYWDMLMSDRVYPLGDLNGDGYNDFAIASYYNWSDGLGKVYVFKGGQTPVDTPWCMLQGPKGIYDFYYGYSVLGIGDFTSSGYKDLLINTINGDSNMVYFYSGNRDKISTIPDKIYGPYTFSFMRADSNLFGNDKPFFILLAGGQTSIYLDPDTKISFSLDGWYGGTVTGTGGDINHDGFNDFLIGNEQFLNSQGVMVGGVKVFEGGSSIDTSGNFIVEGYQKWSQFSHDLDIAGDINGDGYADVFVLAPSYYFYNNPDSTVGRLYIYSYTQVVDAINDNGNTIPAQTELFQNYPNPFNPTTIITYRLSISGLVTLKIYDILGREIITLVNKFQNAGEHSIDFNARNLSSGVYFYQLRSGSFTATKKLLLMK